MTLSKKKTVSSEYVIDEVKYHYNQVFGKNAIQYGNVFLHQVGEMFCDGQKHIPSHKQHCFELTYVVEGKGVSIADGTSYQMQQGDCFISLSGENHEIISSKESPLRFKFLAFNPSNDQPSNCQRYIEIITNYANKRRVVSLPQINGRILNIFNEVENQTIFSGEAVKLEIESILIEVIRGLQSSTNKKYPLKLADQNILIFKVIRAIDSNVQKIKNLYELEDILGYSYNHISAVFKKVMGYSVNDYFIKSKMKYAKNLLSSENVTVTDVSEQLNYSSIHTFTRSFKKYFGYPPCKEKGNK